MLRSLLLYLLVHKIVGLSYISLKCSRSMKIPARGDFYSSDQSLSKESLTLSFYSWSLPDPEEPKNSALVLYILYSNKLTAQHWFVIVFVLS